MNHCFTSIACALLLAAAPTLHNAHAEDDHGHASGPAWALAPLNVGEWKINISASGELVPGGEVNLDIVVKGPSASPKAVRAWIGNETADQTGKTRIGASGHAHVAMPDAPADTDRLWVEVEDASGKKRGSLPIPGAHAEHADHEHDHEHEHEHEHGLSATITAAPEPGVYTLKLEDADLATGDGSKVRLLLIDGSLTDARHLAPTEQQPGTWTFPFSPRKPGPYRAYAIARMGGEDHPEPVMTMIENAGDSEPLETVTATESTVGNLRFSLAWTSEPEAHHEARFVITVRDQSATPPELGDLMGAKAFVFSVGQDADHLSVIAPTVERTADSTTISGTLLHKRPGYRRLLLHVNIGGSEHILRFGYGIEEHGDHSGHNH